MKGIIMSPDQLVSSTKLVRNLSEYLDITQGKKLFIARRNGVEAVLMSLREYRELVGGDSNSEN